MDIDEAIQSRKSVRKFSNKKPDWKDILECVDSSRYAPMAGNNFTLKFIIINNEETIQKISEACQQDFFSKAKYIVCVCSDPTLPINAFGDRGEIYSRQQAGAALQNFLLKITELGLSTCWVGHFLEEQIKDILKIPEKCNVEAIFPIGYEYSETKPKRKRALENCLFFEKYGKKKMKETPAPYA